MKNLLLNLSIHHPRWVVGVAALITVAALVQFPKVRIDTDPENMLPADEPVRIHHSEVKDAFDLSDFLAVGVVHEDGVFTPEILERVARLTAGLEEVEGVVFDDVIAPTEVDDILAMEGGGIRVERLMEDPPATREDAARILARIQGNPLLRGKLASDDGQALMLFIPLEEKHYAEEIAAWVHAFLEDETYDEAYHVAGLPVAEDTFGSAMFQQMALSAPLAFLVIFLLMMFFFRRFVIVAAPMMVAMMTVIWTMGLLIGMGFTVHIMSSMIPVFLIPIAVLDSIHLLSEIHDHYKRHGGMEGTLRWSIDELFAPMAFTSLTTVVGFAALIATPIPPVQVFGTFVAVGVAVAWLLSMTFTPAYAMLVPPRALENFGRTHEGPGAPTSHLHKIMDISLRFRAPLVAAMVVVLGLSAVGISRIVVNDNPTNWFKPSHPIRVADRVMNEHIAGTYMAYLELAGEDDEAFLDPAWMAYLDDLQAHLDLHPNVGGTTSVGDVVKKVQTELRGDDDPGVIPTTREEIAQFLFLYEISGGSPDDLFKFITPGQDRANIWVQMPDGENRSVSEVIDSVEEFTAANPPPDGMDVQWAGLSYINVVWQEKMVTGMGKALLGSFLTVLVMMALLFRSLPLGLVAMIPLTATIALTYGLVGWIGRPYDMPIAVLSSLSLGLSVDFAIHLIQRTRELVREHHGDYRRAMEVFFDSPAQALARNVVVIALGFVPMFFAALVPYQTVGAYFFAIMVVSGGATFLILPAVLSWFRPKSLAGRDPHAKGKTMKHAGAVAALVLMATTVAPAQADEATELMKQAHLQLYYAAEDGVASVEMTITDKKGKEREREFVMVRRDMEDGGEQRYFVYFLKPSDVRRMTFMAWKNPDDDDRRWIFVPALDLIKPISANDKKSSFVGSDFSYEDVSGRHWTDDTHVVARTEELDGIPCTVVESTPKEKDYFARKLTWIDENGLLRREEFYDKKDELVKVFEALSYEDVDGVPTALQRRMSSPKKGSVTEILFSSIRYDVGVEEDVFSERAMKSPPREYIQ